MKNKKFQPFKQYLDQDKTQKLLCDILKSADDGELFLNRSVLSRVV
jgi:hypothetical protein